MFYWCEIILLIKHAKLMKHSSFSISSYVKKVDKIYWKDSKAQHWQFALNWENLTIFDW